MVTKTYLPIPNSMSVTFLKGSKRDSGERNTRKMQILGSKRLMDLLANDLDETDYFFTLKTKLWLVSLLEDERRDMKPILDQLNNESFWNNLFNWRRLERLSGKGHKGSETEGKPSSID